MADRPSQFSIKFQGQKMCDSLALRAFIDEDMTEKEYRQCKYPDKPLDEPVHTSADFRTYTGISPLTGAGYLITPFGQLTPDHVNDERFKHGHIAGYQVDVNPPACMIGHNRQLVVGVPRAAESAVLLLKYWLAVNGCTLEGLDRIKLKNVVLTSVTFTALYPHGTERLARQSLYQFRAHSEALLNKKPKNWRLSKSNSKPKKDIAYSHPTAPVEVDSDAKYTSYANFREYKLSAYVKELDQPNSTCLPLRDDDLEAEVQQFAVRTLRVEIRVHALWLERNSLSKISQWKGDTDGYKTIFNVLRTELSLDKEIRTTQLKKSTVPTLKLSDRNKKYLLHYLDHKAVRGHPDFSRMTSTQASKAYSAARLEIEEKTKINIDVENIARTRGLKAQLPSLLVFPNEFIPAEHLAGYVFSRVSVQVAITQLEAIVENVLESGPDSVPPIQTYTIYRGPPKLQPRPTPVKPHRTGSVGSAPLKEHWDDQ